MIKLKGKYDLGGLEYLKCEIQINKGLISLIKKDTKLGDVTHPINKKDYKIIRTNEEYGLPVTHKYAIKFIDYNNKECYVYADINNVKLSMIKWHKKEWIIQKASFVEQLLIGLILIAIPVFVSFAYNKWFSHPSSYEIIKPITPPIDTTNTNLQKSNEEKTKNNSSNKSTQLDSLNINL